MSLVMPTPAGLYCPIGDFYIDPSQRVDRAIITHAHSDHARRGCRDYLAVHDSRELLRQRLGQRARIQTVSYGETILVNRVRVSLHPAGHILGSAQVRLEYGGEVWVISGDYKLQADPTCAPFEPLRCDVFLTESTFGLPCYRWPAPEQEIARLEHWWRTNQARGVSSVVLAYSLGKAQRILASIARLGPILVHPTVADVLGAYRAAGIRLPEVRRTDDPLAVLEKGRCLIVAPPGVRRHDWWRPFRPCTWALASGWVQRPRPGTSRFPNNDNGHRPQYDAGFILSDHADWPGLQQAVAWSGAQTVWITHGYTEALAAWLRQTGRTAVVLE